MPTPNFITTEEIIMQIGPHDKRVIPAGSNVRPINEWNLDKETLERWGGSIPIGKVIVFTRFGLWPVPKGSIREY